MSDDGYKGGGHKLRIILCSYLVSLLLACSEQSGTSPVAAVEALDPNTRLNFALRNEEIRGDVLRTLIAEGIEHWIDDDGAIGF